MSRIPLLLLFAIIFHGSLARAQVRLVEIGTKPGLRYDVKSFEVSPGQAVQLTFSNQDDMLHNLVVTKPGKREAVVQAALLLGGSGAEKGYVPESGDVLWYSPVVDSGTSVVLEFQAPSQVGDYPFVCTYPGHGFVMFGTMRVKQNPSASIVYNEDEMGPAMNHSMHGDRAIVTRCFMPNAGPASIAVGLPGGYSYCWDAGAVRFRYAWAGGYGEQVYREPMQLEGEVFYREEGGIPFRVGGDVRGTIRKAEFLGYRLDHMGYPEFEYKLDGVLFKERLTESHGAIHRQIKVSREEAAKGVFFVQDAATQGSLQASVAAEDGVFKFPPNGVLELKLSGEGAENE